MGKKEETGSSMDRGLEFAGAWHEFVEFGRWLVETMQPETVVDLGTFKGNSAYAFASGRKDAKVITIDKEEQEEAKILDKVPNIERRVSTFNDQLDSFKDNSIDLIHVDGDHYFNSVMEDVTNWSKKIAPNGVMLIHDVSNGAFIGPLTVFVEVLNTHKLMFMDGNGLGIASADEDIMKAIWHKYWPSLLNKKLIMEYFKNVLSRNGWMQTTLESCAQELGRHDSAIRTNVELMVSRSDLEQWTS